MLIRISAQAVRRWAERWPCNGFPQAAYEFRAGPHSRQGGGFVDPDTGERVPTTGVSGRAVDALETDAADALGLPVGWGLVPDVDGASRLAGGVELHAPDVDPAGAEALALDAEAHRLAGETLGALAADHVDPQTGAFASERR